MAIYTKDELYNKANEWQAKADAYVPGDADDFNGSRFARYATEYRKAADALLPGEIVISSHEADEKTLRSYGCQKVTVEEPVEQSYDFEDAWNIRYRKVTRWADANGNVLPTMDINLNGYYLIPASNAS